MDRIDSIEPTQDRIGLDAHGFKLVLSWAYHPQWPCHWKVGMKGERSMWLWKLGFGMVGDEEAGGGGGGGNGFFCIAMEDAETQLCNPSNPSKP
jgi:hypothetical protein